MYALVIILVIIGVAPTFYRMNKRINLLEERIKHLENNSNDF